MRASRLARPEGFEEVAEQIALSGLDGAACELGVSREEIVLAFSSRAVLERFAREQGTRKRSSRSWSARVSCARSTTPSGRMARSQVADLLRGLVARIPIDELLDLLDRLPGP